MPRDPQKNENHSPSPIEVEKSLESFYNSTGWQDSAALGTSQDAELWEDLRPVASHYVGQARLRILDFLPKTGHEILDAASGPIQYPEYLEYSRGFKKRVCVDISKRALEIAQSKIGSHGEFVCASLCQLPFVENRFDAVVSLHTIYHIHQDEQEKAVRELIRVCKPGAPIVIVYANPNRLTQVLKKAIPFRKAVAGPIYYHAHPLSWWKRFSDECEVEMHSWRFLAAQDSRRIIPNHELGKKVLSGLSTLEKNCTSFAVRLGAYPLIVLRKKT